MGSERVKILKNFIIYTRWGDVVFEAIRYSAQRSRLFGWKGLMKGTKAQAGVYVYQVEAGLPWWMAKKNRRKGTVTLIR
jgi:hypothetical protein